ncbi:fructosamine kinase family protein [Spirochaeta dissipatitropha]
MQSGAILQAESLQEGLHQLFGNTVSIAASSPVSGGCIHDGKRLELSNGHILFCKRNASSDHKVFHAEHAGLLCLRSLSLRSHGPHVPQVYALLTVPGEQFLLMEWIETGSRNSASEADFGRALAALHREPPLFRDINPEIDGIKPETGKSAAAVGSGAVRQFGFSMDNYIGTTPQPNQWNDSWSDFFGQRRLLYLYEIVRRKGLLDSGEDRKFERIMKRLPGLLPEPEHPSVVHGDLWSGNVMYDRNAKAVLIDPAVYLGHHEADLALLELFGKPGQAFFRAYRDEFMLDSGYSQRRELYNLYHLLNHLYIFGTGYRFSVMQAIASYS